MNFNHLKIAVITLSIIVTLFLSAPLAAEEKLTFDEQLAQADNIRSSQPKRFLTLLEALNQNANNITEPQQFYLDYLNLYLLMYQGQLADAIAAANTIINSNADVSLKFRAKMGLVNIFAIHQNWNQGLATLSNLLAELPSIKDNNIQSLGLVVATIFYDLLGQYDLSLSYAKQVEKSSEQGRMQCIAKSLIIQSSFNLKILTPDNPDIRHTISLCRINKEHLYIALIHTYVAKMYLANQQHQKALTLLQANLQNALNTTYPHVIAEYYSLLAQAHWLGNDLALTKQFAIKAIDNDKKEGTSEAKILSYKLLFELEKAQKNYELALLYHEKYVVFDKAYYDENQAKYLAFQLAEHQTLEQKNKIDLLNETNALLTAEKSLLTAEQALIKAKTQNNRYIMMVLIITLSVLSLWGFRLYKAHKAARGIRCTYRHF